MFSAMVWWKVSFVHSQLHSRISPSLSELLSILVHSIDRIGKSTSWKETTTDLVAAWDMFTVVLT